MSHLHSSLRFCSIWRTNEFAYDSWIHITHKLAVFPFHIVICTAYTYHLLLEVEATAATTEYLHRVHMHIYLSQCISNTFMYRYTIQLRHHNNLCAQFLFLSFAHSNSRRFEFISGRKIVLCQESIIHRLIDWVFLFSYEHWTSKIIR